MTTSYQGRLGNAPEEGVKAPVRVETTADIELADLQTINGVAVSANDRVLVKDQSDSAENGIYVALLNQNWVRATDFNKNSDVIAGQLVISQETGYVYRVVADNPWFPGVTDVTFTQIIGSNIFLWGGIGGTLSDQSDLQTALDGKSDTGHSHTESDISDLDKYGQATIDAAFAALTDTFYTETEIDAIITALGDTYYTESEIDAIITALGDTYYTESEIDAIITALGDTYYTETEVDALLSGNVIQTTFTQDGEVATGTTTIPDDDTIPQNTKGNEFMTCSITPTSASNKLKIEVVCNMSHSSASAFYLAAALFQDSTADTLAAGESALYLGTHGRGQVIFTHWMTAGTASSTTFKVRGGSKTAGTVTFNGANSTRVYGGTMASSITITEYAA